MYKRVSTGIAKTATCIGPVTHNC